MHHAMADGRQTMLGEVRAQHGDEVVERAFVAERGAFAPRLLVDHACRRASLATNFGDVNSAFGLPARDERRAALAAREQRELEARRACVEDRDGVGHDQATALAGGLPPRLRDERRDAARREPRRDGVRAAREDDRHPRAEHDAGRVRAREERQALGQHVAGLEIRHDQHVGASGDRRVDLLDLHGLEADRVVERERPVEDAAGDLAAIGHLAQRARLDRRRHLRIDGLHRRQDRDAHLRKAHRVREVDRVLDDVDLVLHRRRDVDRGVA